MKRGLLFLGLYLAGCSGGPAAVEDEFWAWEYPFVGAPCSPDRPGQGLSSVRRDSIAPVEQRYETIDDRWAQIARQAPGGWGGRFVVDNRLTIYLTHPEDAERALPVLNQLGAGVGSRPDIRQGRWDFAQLYDWRRYFALRGLWTIEGVYMSDIDEKRNRLVYGVTSSALPSVAQLLSDLRVPCGLVEASVGPNGFTLD